MPCQLHCPNTGAACANADVAVVCAWNKLLMDRLAEPQADAGDAVAAAHAAHWEALNMDVLLAPFVGKPEAFYGFLQERWNWIITPDADGRGLTADENKRVCVCPLVRAGAAAGPMLCRCSEGFTGRMFSTVLGKPVRAEVTESILRGGSHCVYRLSWGKD